MHATPNELYTLSLHDALPILDENPRAAGLHTEHIAARSRLPDILRRVEVIGDRPLAIVKNDISPTRIRSEEHTSELQSPVHLVCRLLLEKKKNDTLKSTRK